jgi:RHH-type transcriptional regulator, proline utilization regulon repressor / proline dehydrogenase / delta 1-pyrroline-5-carboxylate dehydrogenase
VRAIGSEVLWLENGVQKELFRELPKVVQSRITLTNDWQAANISFDAAIYHGDADQLRILCEQIAQIDDPIISVQGFARGETNILLDRLLIERSLSVNTAAAGGNASLMTIG